MSVQVNDFLGNILYGVHFLRKVEERVLLNPLPEHKWLPALAKDTITYVPESNRIVIPEHILLPPFFSLNYPQYVVKSLNQLKNGEFVHKVDVGLGWKNNFSQFLHLSLRCWLPWNGGNDGAFDPWPEKAIEIKEREPLLKLDTIIRAQWETMVEGEEGGKSAGVPDSLTHTLCETSVTVERKWWRAL